MCVATSHVHAVAKGEARALRCAAAGAGVVSALCGLVLHHTRDTDHGDSLHMHTISVLSSTYRLALCTYLK